MQGDVPDYMQIRDDEGGQLYSFRVSQNEVVLRTRFQQSSSGRLVVGIQDVAKGSYRCVVTNFEESNSTEVEIEPTGNNDTNLGTLIAQVCTIAILIS